jgi:hypothetical protein
MKREKKPLNHYHRFLDEAGDMTFYGKGRVPILGEQGVSHCFILGMVKFHADILPIRQKLFEMQNSIPVNPYYENVPSVVKRVKKGGFYFHAKDDLPELRKEFFDFIKTLDCSFYVVVARKNYGIFERKHHGKSNEMYADLLSHLIEEEQYDDSERIVYNIASLQSTTDFVNLKLAFDKAKIRYKQVNPLQEFEKKIDFNVQPFAIEPLLSVVDYLCWAVQRKFETGEIRFMNYMESKIVKIINLYEGQ